MNALHCVSGSEDRRLENKALDLWIASKTLRAANQGRLIDRPVDVQRAAAWLRTLTRDGRHRKIADLAKDTIKTLGLSGIECLGPSRHPSQPMQPTGGVA